jgi:elongation factor Tu
VTGAIDVGERLVAPGDHAGIKFRLHKPVGLQAGMRFAVREGGKTVGAGVVTAIAP